MITPYFSDSERTTVLKTAAQSWVGTPFHPKSQVKGRFGGVSCVGLIHGIAIEIGLIEQGEIDLPAGPIAWHQHNDMSLLSEFFRSPQIRGRVKRLEVEDGLQVGDLLPFKLKRTENHLSWLIDDTHVIHCHRKKGVMVSSLRDVMPFINGLYRIYQ